MSPGLPAGYRFTVLGRWMVRLPIRVSYWLKTAGKVFGDLATPSSPFACLIRNSIYLSAICHMDYFALYQTSGTPSRDDKWKLMFAS